MSQENIKLAKKVIDSFNTWSFKREQPKSKESLVENILLHIKKKEPIKFIMYWGKGDRDIISNLELDAIKYLVNFCETIKKEYVYGVELTFIFTDTHAAINGYDAKSTKIYFESTKNLIDKYKIKSLYLSEIVSYKQEDILNKLSSTKIDESLFDNLKNSSEKHCKNFNNNYEICAKVYYLQNQLEKKKVEERFQDYVFLTYNGSDLNKILPIKLPIFYMYSLKKGFSDKPWFYQ